ncbi:MAG TPA: hypothetical protein PK357_03360 [Candidatus Pacearchaeota archaeon]|nr:hypothetical protein [Candidatus Pacearchaeota archaeon]
MTLKNLYNKIKKEFNKKKQFKEIKGEIKDCLNNGDYRFAGVIAENSGYKKLEKLAGGYYNIAIQKFKEKNILKHLFPTEKSHKDILEKIINISEYSLDKFYIKN